MKPEIISALMPAFLASLGVAFGICAMFASNLSENVRSGALGVSGAAITGAAGLARPEIKRTESDPQ